MIYACFITSLISSVADDIILGMVNKGYAVGAAGETVFLETPNSPSSLIGLNVIHSRKIVNAAEVHRDLNQIMMEKNVSFYSVIVFPSVQDAFWSSSNIAIPVSNINEDDLEQTLLMNDIKKSNLN